MTLTRKHLIMVLIFAIIIGSRFVFIDSDISAPWGVLNYQSIDEGIYANLALNKINFGEINPNISMDKQYEFLMQSHVITNILGNAVIYLGLRIFGDNFLGFRIGPIVIAFLIVLLFYFSMNNIYRKIVYKNSSSKWLYFLVPLTSMILSYNFVFYNASRLVEPTIFRMFFLMLIIYVFTSRLKSFSLKAFLIVFLTVISIFMVYVTNVFILLAIGLLVIYWLIKKKYNQCWIFIKYGFLGGICAYLISFSYYAACWNIGPIKNLILCITSFGTGSGYDIGLNNRVDNISAFISSNILLYNPILIIGFIWGIYYIYINRKKVCDEIVFALFLILSLLIQTLISEDYIVRKSLVIMPAFLFLCFYAGYCYMTQNTRKKISIKLNILCFCAILYSILYRLYFVKNQTNLDFSYKDKVILAMSFLGIVGCFILKYFIKNRKTLFIYALCLIIIGSNSLFIIKYNWMNQTYTDKNIMLELNDVVGNDYVLGEYVNGFTLYNNIMPILNTQEVLKKYMTENNSLYYFDYSNYNTYNLDDNYLNYYVDTFRQFPRAFKTFGYYRDMSLFKWRVN